MYSFSGPGRHALLHLTIVLTFSATHALATELDPVGPTYRIAEQSALEMIVQTLRDKARRGELKSLQAAATRRALDSARHPAPVAGITTVSAHSERFVDPTVTVAQAVTTDTGHIIVPAGTRLNPLSVLTLSKRLVFFDGRDPRQCAAVQRMLKASLTGVKAILVAGSWQDLSRAWKTQVYFDQRGTLSQRFGIHAVPTVIRQQGTMLVLEEVPAGELR